ncbi:PAS domain S-box protein [Geobacter sp. DSM 9736]|uniref:PAS domain-containing sensor histidine kinase n=1 Tax=Geobacter sp. DSM 9736 TaxID=1277350 RepID=UPI000B509E5D|nr:PAS domain S-box protein [Geobacter sp. DSM 9736]SNB47870.1 PAS/PAC sensor signal transduction histidine kinase [Geobacter sp. DSM 9736]
MFRQKNNRILLEHRRKELLACYRRFQSLMQRCLHGMLIVDSGNRIRYANAAAERIYGSSARQLQGKPFPFPIPPDGTTETQISTSEGRGIILEMSALETEWRGKPAWLVWLQDITERKRSEQELRKMYRAVHESPVNIVITDPLGTIEYVNPKFTETTGFSPADTVGTNLAEYKPGLKVPKTYQQMREAVTGGNEWRGELISCRKNGELFHESISIAPIEDTSGTVTNFVAIIEDVTDRKRYEEQLRSSERQLAEAQKIAHLGSWKRYIDTGKSFWSDELYRIFGLEPGAVAASLEQFLKMLHPEDMDEIRRRAEFAITEPDALNSYYFRIVRPDGSIRVLLGQEEVLTDCGNKPIMVIGTALDVTERKVMEEEIEQLNRALEARAAELEAANRELESFSYTVCHDLRSPLTSIHGYSQVLADLCENQLDDKCKGFLSEIRRGTERMNELIETLLEFSLLTQSTLKEEEVDLSEIAKEILADLQFEWPDRRVEVEVMDGLLARGDLRLLRIVMRNLLGNAWKYTAHREMAKIRFGAVTTGGHPAFFVKDNGRGFRAEDAHRLFAPFQRLPGSDEVEGHGIGLATVLRIIERHGGSVWAEGEPDRGATFYFSI